jgi:hypothetical protein
MMRCWAHMGPWYPFHSVQVNPWHAHICEKALLSGSYMPEWASAVCVSM